eukprot:g868.t1
MEKLRQIAGEIGKIKCLNLYQTFKMLSRRSFILGGTITPFIGARHPDFICKNHVDFGKRKNPTLEELIFTAVHNALDATDTPAALVDKAWIGNFAGELFCNQGQLGAVVAGSHPDLINKPVMRVEGACASGGLALAAALDSVQSTSDIALVVGAEVQTATSAREGARHLATASYYRKQKDIDDFVFPAIFARRVKACMLEFGWSAEDLAIVSAKAYSNAALNPLAHMHSVGNEMDVKAALDSVHFLNNPELKPYMKLSDCSQVSDGAAALILVNENGLAKLGKTTSDCIEIIGQGQATGSLFNDSDPLRLPTTVAAAEKAYNQAGVLPEDIGVMEVHDCFTVTEALMLEALGFATEGNGMNLIREGRTNITGDIPCNTGGGLVGFGHPVGATGIKQLLELYRQMKGQCGDYQMSTTPQVGLAANMGGDDKTAVVTIVANR